VLLLDGELQSLLFGERLDTVLALPGGYAIEDLPEVLFPNFAEVAPESILYDVGFLAAFPARSLARPLDESPIYPGFGAFHNWIILRAPTTVPLPHHRTYTLAEHKRTPHR
jgi:hypothetical protein